MPDLRPRSGDNRGKLPLLTRAEALNGVGPRSEKADSRGSVMLNPAVSRPSRPWREIAAEVTQEKDSVKLAKLVEELNRAMSEQCVRPTSTRERPEAS